MLLLPHELISIIYSYLMPCDAAALASTNKFIRACIPNDLHNHISILSALYPTHKIISTIRYFSDSILHYYGNSCKYPAEVYETGLSIIFTTPVRVYYKCRYQLVTYHDTASSIEVDKGFHTYDTHIDSIAEAYFKRFTQSSTSIFYRFNDKKEVYSLIDERSHTYNT